MIEMMIEILKFIGLVFFGFTIFIFLNCIVLVMIREAIRFYFMQKEVYLLRLGRHKVEDEEQEFQIH